MKKFKFDFIENEILLYYDGPKICIKEKENLIYYFYDEIIINNKCEEQWLVIEYNPSLYKQLINLEINIKTFFLKNKIYFCEFKDIDLVSNLIEDYNQLKLPEDDVYWFYVKENKK